MAISEELAKILAARYGRDVRQAIHDAIEENYEDVSAARTLADSATTAANNAASLANTKAGLADEKASLADTKAGLADSAATAANNAASLANTKAGLADEKASLANTKAGLADSAATAANNAASLANTKAGLADSAATAANNAASLANTKAGLADEKASLADTKAGLADSAATAANNAASLANTKAGLADSAATAANNAASLANTKAGLADEAAQDATDAAAYANAITQKYIHIRYSAINPDSDDDMTSTPSDWIGIYSGTSASAPTSYTAYAWFKYKGETGNLSIYGVGNDDGNIPLNNGVVSVNLNADKLDGLDSTDFAAAVHNHDSAYLGKTAQAADSDKLDGVHLADIRLGQNLLHNWDFRNPINQRGVVTGFVPSYAYTYDRWLMSQNAYIDVGIAVTLTVNNGTPKVIDQRIESDLRGKTYTISVDLIGAGIKSVVSNYPSNGDAAGGYYESLEMVLVRIGNYDTLHIVNWSPSVEYQIKRVKLELGTVSTLHLDPPMDRGRALQDCLPYFIKFEDYFPRVLGFANVNGVVTEMSVSMPCIMRAAPTINVTSISAVYGSQVKMGSITGSILRGNQVALLVNGISGLPIYTPVTGSVEGTNVWLSSDL